MATNLDPTTLDMFRKAKQISGTKASPKRVADTLDKAADILAAEKQAWCTGALAVTPDGGEYFAPGQVVKSVCALGAISLTLDPATAWRTKGNRFYLVYPSKASKYGKLVESYIDQAMVELYRSRYEWKSDNGNDGTLLGSGNAVVDFNDSPSVGSREGVISFFRAQAKRLRGGK